jgi:hypothetical protein
MDEGRSRTITAVCSITSAVVVVAGIGWNAYTFSATRFDALKRPVFEKELDTCIDATKAAETIVHGSDKHSIAEARNKFQSSYVGSLRLIGDLNVATQAKRFSQCLSNPACTDLPAYEFELSRACRAAVQGSVNAVLPEVAPVTGLKAIAQ